jgi:hypothetical protein
MIYDEFWKKVREFCEQAIEDILSRTTITIGGGSGGTTTPTAHGNESHTTAFAAEEDFDLHSTTVATDATLGHVRTDGVTIEADENGILTVLGAGSVPEHDHDTADITSGVFDLARLPVAASGVTSATELVRADDERLEPGAPATRWEPLTNGLEEATELIFTANGDVIMVEMPYEYGGA